MRWTLGLLLLGAVGCGYHQTKMVACPENGCPQSYASASPEGLPKSSPPPAVKPMAPILPPAAPIEPLPDTTPPEPLPPTP